MGNYNDKEEIVVAQATGTGGTSVTTTDIATGGLFGIVMLAILYFCFRQCKKKCYKDVTSHVSNNIPLGPMVPTVSARCCGAHAHGTQNA